MHTYILQNKIEARKLIAKYKMLLVSAPRKDKLAITSTIIAEKKFLDFDFSNLDDKQVKYAIHTLRHKGAATDICDKCNTLHYVDDDSMFALDPLEDIPEAASPMPTLGDLQHILRQNAENERASAQSSSTAFKRWALKDAVSEYYLNLSYDTETPIVQNNGDMRTIRGFAPNKNTIHQLWLQKLQSAHAGGDSNMGRDDYTKVIDRGIPRGGAFEKQLDRYRRRFMAQLWKKFNNWGKE